MHGIDLVGFDGGLGGGEQAESGDAEKGVLDSGSHSIWVYSQKLGECKWAALRR
jgi:hypothetical protein